MSASDHLVVDVHLVLERFSLSVHFETHARVVGLWGPSGSGKTTLVETLAGLRRGAAGRIVCGTQVWLDSSASHFVRPEQRGVGYVPQDSLLFPNLNVKGNLAAGARRARASPSATDQLIAHAAHTLRIEHLLDRDVAALSGGERQRVALARALCSAPSFLLLDEPFASLDVALRRELLPFLAQVRDEARVPMLLVSHDPTEIQILCDEVIALRDGAIEAQGPPHDVIGASSALARQRNLGFENVVRGVVLASTEGRTTVRLGPPQADSKVSIDVPQRSSVSVGAPAFVGLHARDILIAKGELGRLSARNRLDAKVTSVDPIGAVTVVHVRIVGVGEDLAIEVTPEACHELALRPNDDVTVVFKASACTLYSLGV